MTPDDQDARNAPASQPPTRGGTPTRLTEMRSVQRQFLLVGLLLVVMVALLAFLWTRERRLRRSVQAELDRTMVQQQALNQSLGNLLVRQMTGHAVSREDLPARTAELDGKPVAILQLSAAAGHRLGFEPGDIIQIAVPPATAPGMSAPAMTAPGMSAPEETLGAQSDTP